MEEEIIIEKDNNKNQITNDEVLAPATPSSFDSRRFSSTITNIASDLSENSTSPTSLQFHPTTGQRLCAKFCCLHPRDFLQFCVQCLIICPSFCVTASFVMGVAIVISLFSGRGSVRNKNIVNARFFGEFIHNHIKHTELSVDSIAKIEGLKQFVCDPDDFSAEQELIDDYLLQFVEENTLFLHHVRVILSNGSEISRIDLEHDDTSSISQVKYDVSNTPYHQDFLSGKSQTRAYSGKWTTHGPLKFGTYYDYSGEDLTGDHHPDHIEYLPLPQIIRVQKSVKCNETYFGGYIIFNVRMVLLLNEIDATNELYNVIIINSEGDYVFFNRERDKEFQSDLGKEKTIDDDWGIGSNRIMTIFSDTEHSDIFTIGSNEFLCYEIVIGEYHYHICVIVSSLQAFHESPVPLVVGVMIDIGLLGIIFCCYYNCVIRQQSRRHEKLIKNIYPKGMKASLPFFFRRPGIARPIMATYQPSLAIMFGDIYQLMDFNECFKNDPIVVVTILSRVIDTIDVFAQQFDVHKIKTMGNCYFGVIGLDFKRKSQKNFLLYGNSKNLDKQLSEDREKVKKMIKFCCLFQRYFSTRRLIVKLKNLDDEEFECPEWRIGISFGGAIGGVLSLRTPFFDLWGRPVGLASHLEEMAEPGQIHITKRVRDMIHKEAQFDFTTIKQSFVKGYGYMDTYFVKIRKFKVLDEMIKKMCKNVLKKYENHFFRKKSKSEIEEVNATYQNEIMQEIVLQLESQNRAYFENQLRNDEKHQQHNFKKIGKEEQPKCKPVPRNPSSISSISLYVQQIQKEREDGEDRQLVEEPSTTSSDLSEHVVSPVPVEENRQQVSSIESLEIEKPKSAVLHRGMIQTLSFTESSYSERDSITIDDLSD